MSNDNYENLSYARKYRPTGLVRYIGNTKAVEAVMRTLQRKNPAQTICLEGEKGCGKTSLGRLIGKEYLCENRDPVKGACGECPNCIEIERYIKTGKTEDLLVDSFITEINVALDRGVKDVESIIEEAYFPSLGDEWRIRLFDEFQMASPAAQAAMLKIIEEPPEKTLWIFCTTEPDKINSALYTRFQLKLQIKKPKLNDLKDIMKYIASKEKFTFQEKALALIAAREDYIIRNALNTLERIVGEYGEVTYENTLDTLQEVADELLFEFYNKLLNMETMEYIRLIHKIKQKMDIKSFIQSLENFTNRGIFILNDSEVDGLSEKEMELYKKLFSRFTVSQICVLLERITDMKHSLSAETKLLALGYSGLDDIKPSMQNTSRLQKVNFIEELENEKGQSLKSVSENTKLNEKAEAEYLETLTGEVSTEELLGLFGSNIAKFED